MANETHICRCRFCVCACMCVRTCVCVCACLPYFLFLDIVFACTMHTGECAQVQETPYLMRRWGLTQRGQCWLPQRVFITRHHLYAAAHSYDLLQPKPISHRASAQKRLFPLTSMSSLIDLLLWRREMWGPLHIKHTVCLRVKLRPGLWPYLL